MAWHGMVWYGMVWYGMVWHSPVAERSCQGEAGRGPALAPFSLSAVWYGVVWYGMVWYGMVCNGGSHHNAVYCSRRHTYYVAYYRIRSMDDAQDVPPSPSIADHTNNNDNHSAITK